MRHPSAIPSWGAIGKVLWGKAQRGIEQGF